jgi:biotin transport system substrate-specific component
MQFADARPRLIVDAVWPGAGVVRESVLALAGALLIALAAQLRIALPFSPVPVTGQTFAVLLLAAAYGSRRGAATVLTYLGMGLAGMPVFASAPPGLAVLAAPTAGYLAGYLPAAFVVGWLSERGAIRSPWTTAAAMIAGNIVIYAAGVAWLSRFLGWESVFGAGVTPFIVGDLAKITLATILLPFASRIAGDGSLTG